MHSLLHPHDLFYAAAGYIAKPSQSTLQEVQKMRFDEHMNKGYEAGNGHLEPVTVPFPLEKTTSVHVRHGDKGIEMSLIPFSKYVAAADQLAIYKIRWGTVIPFLLRQRTLQ